MYVPDKDALFLISIEEFKNYTQFIVEYVTMSSLPTSEGIDRLVRTSEGNRGNL